MDKYKKLKEVEEVLALSDEFPPHLKESLELGIDLIDYEKACTYAQQFIHPELPWELKRFIEISVYSDIRLGVSRPLPNGALEITDQSSIYCSGMDSVDVTNAIVNGCFSILSYLMFKGD